MTTAFEKALIENISSGLQTTIESLALHLADKLNLNVEDVNEAINSYGTTPYGVQEAEPASKPKAAKGKTAKSSTKGKTPPAKTAKGKVAKGSDQHTCDYIINSKANGAHQCGSKAKNMIETDDGEKWYCGTQESGHYKSALNNQKKETTKAPAKQAKAKTPTKKVVKQQEIRFIKHKETGLYIEPQTRIVADKDTHISYGMLDDENNVVDLTQDAIAFLETHNLEFKVKAKGKAKTAKTPAKAAKGKAAKSPAKSSAKGKAKGKTAKKSPDDEILEQFEEESKNLAEGDEEPNPEEEGEEGEQEEPEPENPEGEEEPTVEEGEGEGENDIEEQEEGQVDEPEPEEGEGEGEGEGEADE